ncbi:MAG: glycoside hydrolase family 65 protein [Kribbellaceae bacterium]
MNDWTLRFEGYDAVDERRREALCTVGNGMFATRGAWPGSRADDVHYPGTYLAGCYNRLSDDIAGRRVENESLVNVPDWLPLSFAIEDGDWLTPDTAKVLQYDVELDLRRGVLTRRFRLADEQGRTISGVERRFVSMADPHFAGQALTLTAENWFGRLVVRAGVDGAVRNQGVERYRALSGQHLSGVERLTRDDGTAMVAARTSQSEVRLAVASRTVVADDEHARWTPVGGGLDALRQVTLTVAAGRPVTLRKVAAVYGSRDPAVSEPGLAALSAVTDGLGFDALLERHVLAWSHLWKRFAVDLNGSGDGTLHAARLNVFHLLQSVSPHSADVDAGVPARGLHGEAYRGHVFWDELFVFPVLTLRMPALTRALLLYRYQRLPAARRAAREAGLPGAMYPWQSGSDGREESQLFHLNPMSGRWTADVTYRQRHVGLAVAYTMWQYVEATGDTAFLMDHGAEVIVEVARFFAGLASYDASRDRFVIRGVVGPDEFHTGYPGSEPAGIDNNAYTNVMTVWLLRRAAEVLDRLPAWRRTELTESIGLRPEELNHWDELCRRMYVPFHDDGVISQFEGYGELAELDWDDYRRIYGDIRRLDRILEAEGRSVNDFQVSKQADVLMLLYLLSPGELCDLMERLGYPVTTAVLRKTVEYYLERTSHGSTLSALVHAWGLASVEPDRTLEFLAQTLRSDIGDQSRGTTSEGIHLAAMAGSIDLLQRRFTGLALEADALRFAPSWPRALGTLRMTMLYREQRLEVRISADQVRVSAEAGTAAPIEVCCHGQTRELRAGASVVFRTPGQRIPTG